MYFQAYFKGVFRQYRRSKLFQLLNYAVSTAEVDVPPHDLRILASSSFLAELP